MMSGRIVNLLYNTHIQYNNHALYVDEMHKGFFKSYLFDFFLSLNVTFQVSVEVVPFAGRFTVCHVPLH